MARADDRPDSLRQVTEVLGAVAGIAALIYVAGGAIYYVRLSMYGIEGVTVIGSLPREFLVSVGLLGFAGPWLLGICLYVVGGLWWKPDAEKKQRRIIVLAIPITLVVAGVVVATRFDGIWSVGLGALIVVAVVIFIAVLATVSRVDEQLRTEPDPDRPGKRHARAPNDYFEQPAMLFRRAAIQGLLLVPAGLTLAAGLPLQRAEVCPSRAAQPMPAPLEGRYLGQSKERVWLAEVNSTDVSKSRIAAAPLSSANRIYVYAPDAPAPAC